MTQTYAEKISDLMGIVDNRLSLGIDPPPSEEPMRDLPFFAAQWKRDPIDFINRFCEVCLEAAQGHVASIKFQSAFFEALGPEGYAVLRARMAQASASGLSVILDVKRGDISTSMAAYGRAAFDHLSADAMTVNTYMGDEVLKALLPWLQKGRGAFLVWMTSNPTARAVQNARLASGETVADLIFAQARDFGTRHEVARNLGFVLGATRFDDLTASQRERLAAYAMLLPGIGPQGGEVGDELKSFIRSCPAAVVPMSRALTGIGDSAQTAALSAVNSWDAYGAYIRNRISVAAEALSC